MTIHSDADRDPRHGDAAPSAQSVPSGPSGQQADRGPGRAGHPRHATPLHPIGPVDLTEPLESRAPARPTGAPGAVRGRPRDAALDRALLEATLEVLYEKGYGGLTTSAVAKRAGVSTATLYRRWKSKDDLVVGTAVRWAHDLGPGEDTGTLSGDLTALLTDKARTLDGPGGRLLHVLIGESAHNRALAQVLDDAVVQPVRDRAGALIERAVGRAEIPPVADPHVLADLVVGAMVSRVFLTPRPRPAETRAPEAPARAGEAMIAELLPFLLRALGAPDHRPAHGTGT
ncbi:TetR/AcrR family transcriptional regulator [Streptomyces sp. NPDC088745]|uniref:TetR/AcrR family transcriptional regulator n=1 Tax=Streptomyces sp. NPDC088745 TaxID=3365884 RepID=UPI00381207DB